MALYATHNDTRFGVGDMVKVSQLVRDGEKSRTQIFEGMVLAIRGRGLGKSFVVRRIGAAQIGIEKIFPLATPTVQSVEVVKKGTRGSRRAKLYYTRDKSRKEITKIYSRSNRREAAKEAAPSSKEVHKKLVKKTEKKSDKKETKAKKKITSKKTKSADAKK